MMAPRREPPDGERLRSEALQRLRDGRPSVEQMPERDVKALLHELEIHHVELQVQNEELSRAQQQLAEARDEYRDLYEYAPAGYLTLDPEGRIVQANLAATRLFGVERIGVPPGSIRHRVAVPARGRWVLPGAV